MKVTSHPVNDKGRDFVAGDIHGAFDKLDQALSSVGFDASKDRLFSVGDLVDRGSYSADVLKWIEKPWFFPVMGNHELMALQFMDGGVDAGVYEFNGGGWFIRLDESEKAKHAQAFASLPLAIEVQISGGMVGIVHAECFGNWDEFKDSLSTHDGINGAICGRERYYEENLTQVDGVSAVFVGHSPVSAPVSYGNVVYIDTGAVFGGPMTLFEIPKEAASLQNELERIAFF